MILEHDLMQRFKNAISEAGSQKKWALAHGFAPQYVCDMLMGRKPISPNVATVLGFERLTVYVPVSRQDLNAA